MVMRAMRDSAKWVMLVLTLAFVGWLVFDWVQGGGGQAAGANPVVGRVGDAEIRYAEWNRYLQNQMELARMQDADGMTEEEARGVREQAWDQLVSELLIRSELDRLGIEVTDQEIRQAFRTSPPPELVSHPAFQTEGRFDIQKYRQYFASPNVDPQLLLQIEDYYRRTLPRIKLLNRLAEGILVSEPEAWQHFQDTNETVRVRYVTVDPAALVPDSQARVTDSEVRAYYREHREEFERPATARVNLVSFALRPSPEDSARTRARMDTLRRVVVSEERSFQEVAAEVNADSLTTAGRGAAVSRVRGEMDPALEEVAFSLDEGEVSEPLATPAGLSLLKVEERAGDTVRIRQLRLAVEPSMATEDSVFDRIDRFEGIALETDLVTAADSLGVPVRRDVSLTRGGGTFVPGAGPLGVGVDWAFGPEARPGDLSPFFQNASGYHVLELLDRLPEGTYALEEVSDEIRRRLVRRKREEAARERLQEAASALESGTSLEEVAARNGWSVRESRPFRRVDFVPGLGQRTEAVGAAFGLPVGATSGVVDADGSLALLEVLERTPVSREAFEEVKEQLQQELTMQRRQEYTQVWMEELRERAEVQDMRDVLQSQQAAAS